MSNKKRSISENLSKSQGNPKRMEERKPIPENPKSSFQIIKSKNNGK